MNGKPDVIGWTCLLYHPYQFRLVRYKLIKIILTFSYFFDLCECNISSRVNLCNYYKIKWSRRFHVALFSPLSGVSKG